jgi:hypothetical protein
MSKDGKRTNSKPAKDNSGRNRLLWSGGVGLAAYLVALTVQALLYAPGWLGNWGVWVVAPLAASAVAARMTLQWLRCRAASRSLQKERDLLVSHVRELTYNINNPLNAITAHLVSLKTEFNPGSVEQIELSSRRIAKVVGKLANIDVDALKQADAASSAGGGVDVEQIGRAGSL